MINRFSRKMWLRESILLFKLRRKNFIKKKRSYLITNNSNFCSLALIFRLR